MKDPDTYLNDLGITLAGAVDPSQPAVIDAAHRVSVNWETYYVSSEANRERFLETPWAYTGEVTDPVGRVRFRPDAASPSRSYDGKQYLFSNEASAKQFDEDPAMYAEPMLSMVESP